MSNNASHQRGFGVVEVLVALVAVVIVGLIGWVILRSKQTANNIPTTSTSASTVPASKPSNTLTISEWGIKLNVGSVTDATYKLVGNNQAYLITTSALNDPKCTGYSADRPAHMALVRGRATDQPIFGDYVSDAPTTVQAAAAKWPGSYNKLGDYYYYVVSGNGSSCGNADEINLDNVRNNLSKIQLAL